MLPGDHNRAEEIGFIPKEDKRSASFIDASVARIFELVGRKGMDLPGIDITFDVYGKNDAPIHYITDMAGDFYGQKWAIFLGRSEYTFDNQYVHTAANEVIVPQHRLGIFNDGNGAYTRYVGDDWEGDQDYFFKSTDFHTGGRNMSRTYLQYNNQGAKYVYHKDLEEDDEKPEDYDEIEVFFQVDRFLEMVIQDLERYPDAKETAYQKWEQLMAVKEMPAPVTLPSLFVTVYEDERKDTESILYHARRTLCPLKYSKSKEYPVPEIARQGFNFGFADKPTVSETGLYGADPVSPDAKIYKVDLKNINDIYVVDETPLIASQNYYKSEHEGVSKYTAEEMSAQYAAISKTIIPLGNYQGNFEKPIYLIGRPLQQDEVIDVTGQRGLWRDNAKGISDAENEQQEKNHPIRKPDGP